MLKSYRYLYFSAHVWTISSESWNHSHFVVQETHSSSIVYLDPGKCDCKANCSCIKSPELSWCVFLRLISSWHTWISVLLEAMFDMLSVFPLFFPDILLSPFTRQLSLRDDWRENSRFMLLWLHLTQSVSPNSNSRATQQARGQNTVRMPTTQAVVPFLTGG